MSDAEVGAAFRGSGTTATRLAEKKRGPSRNTRLAPLLGEEESMLRQLTRTHAIHFAAVVHSAVTVAIMFASSAATPSSDWGLVGPALFGRTPLVPTYFGSVPLGEGILGPLALASVVGMYRASILFAFKRLPIGMGKVADGLATPRAVADEYVRSTCAYTLAALPLTALGVVALLLLHVLYQGPEQVVVAAVLIGAGYLGFIAAQTTVFLAAWW